MGGTGGGYTPTSFSIPEFTVDRQLTGPAFNIVAQLPGLWHDVPGVSVNLPSTGIYTFDGVMFSAIRAQTPAHFAITGRFVNAADAVVSGSKMVGAIFAKYFDGASGADFDGDLEVAHQGHASFTYVAPAADTLRMQARFERLEPPASGPVDPISGLIRNDDYGVTSVRAVLIPSRTT